MFSLPESVSHHLFGTERRATRTRVALQLGASISLFTLASLLIPEALDAATPSSATAQDQAMQDASAEPSNVESNADFMTVVLQNAHQARRVDNTQEGGHSCVDIPTIDESTAPDLMTREGWLEATNDLRAAFGKEPLELDPRLEVSAERTASTLGQLGVFEHLQGYGQGASSVFREVDEATIAGENLAMLSTDTLQTRLGMFTCLAQSSSHLRNTLRDSYTHMNIGEDVYFPGSDLEQRGIDGVLVIHFVSVPAEEQS